MSTLDADQAAVRAALRDGPRTFAEVVSLTGLPWGRASCACVCLSLPGGPVLYMNPDANPGFYGLDPRKKDEAP